MSNFMFPETDLIGCKYLPKVEGSVRNKLPEIPTFAKEYTYRLLPGATKPKVGDFAVVANSTGLGVCVVTTLNKTTPDSFDPDTMSYVIGTVSPDAFKEFMEKKEQKKALWAALQKKKKELEDTIALEVFAERSPEFKELLEAYKSIDVSSEN